MRRPDGHTLLELMFVVAILGLVTAFAVPDLSRFIAEQRVVARANQLVATVRLGRNAAASRRRAVTLCPGIGREACEASFSEGWTLFVDRNDDHVLDPDEEVLAAQGAVEGVTMESNRDWYRFRPAGRGSNGRIALCSGTAWEAARVVVIAPIGRPRIVRATAAEPLPCAR